MTIITKFFCDQCEEDLPSAADAVAHDCPESPENVEKRDAENEIWKARFELVNDAWEKWEETHPMKYCRPSIDFLPHETAVKGDCLLFGTDEDGERHYTAHTLHNPTWGQVALEFDRIIRLTDDHHHCFLEGLDKVESDNVIDLYEFSTGS